MVETIEKTMKIIGDRTFSQDEFLANIKIF